MKPFALSEAFARYLAAVLVKSGVIPMERFNDAYNQIVEALEDENDGASVEFLSLPIRYDFIDWEQFPPFP